MTRPVDIRDVHVPTRREDQGVVGRAAEEAVEGVGADSDSPECRSRAAPPPQAGGGDTSGALLPVVSSNALLDVAAGAMAVGSAIESLFSTSK